MEAIKFRRRYGAFHGVKDIQSLCSPVSFLLLLVSKKQKTKNKTKKRLKQTFLKTGQNVGGGCPSIFFS